MESTTSPSAGPSAPDPNQNGADAGAGTDHSMFECNICLDTAKDAVISMCGHLFCWPCLHQWLETRPNRSICPVCKAGISRDKVIPLYGRGSTAQQDPRDKVPPRPQGQRTEPAGGNSFQFGDAGTGGFSMSFGIGAFPFSFFATNFNLGGFGDERPGPAAQGTRQHADEQSLSKFFIFVAVIFMFWLLMA